MDAFHCLKNTARRAIKLQFFFLSKVSPKSGTPKSKYNISKDLDRREQQEKVSQTASSQTQVLTCRAGGNPQGVDTVFFSSLAPTAALSSLSSWIS